MAAKPRRKVRPPRQTRPPSSAAETLDYEICSLVNAVRVLKRASAPPSDLVLCNLSIETFLLHARILRDFFVGTGDKRDILVIDYLPRKPRFRLPTLRKTRNRLDKLLAHPSYQRARLKKYKRWPVMAMHDELLAAWNLFLEHLATSDPKARQDFRKLGH